MVGISEEQISMFFSLAWVGANCIYYFCSSKPLFTRNHNHSYHVNSLFCIWRLLVESLEVVYAFRLSKMWQTFSTQRGEFLAYKTGGKTLYELWCSNT
jgi:hypothetical protein